MTREQFLEHLVELQTILLKMWDERDNNQLFELYKKTQDNYNELVTELLVRDPAFYEEIKKI